MDIHPSHRSAFTLIELLICVAIIAVLASLLFPMLTKIRARAEALVCASNLRQVGMGVSAFSDDNEGFLVDAVNASGENWYMSISTYLTPVSETSRQRTVRGLREKTNVLSCPEWQRQIRNLSVTDPHTRRIGYAYNAYLDYPNSNQNNMLVGTPPAGGSRRRFTAGGPTHSSQRILIGDGIEPVFWVRRDLWGKHSENADPDRHFGIRPQDAGTTGRFTRSTPRSGANFLMLDGSVRFLRSSSKSQRGVSDPATLEF